MKKTAICLCAILAVCVAAFAVYAVFIRSGNESEYTPVPEIYQRETPPQNIVDEEPETPDKPETTTKPELPYEYEALPEPEEEPELVLPPIEEGQRSELPVNGATGWAATTLPLRDEPLDGAETVANLTPGQGFTILQEDGAWWQVRLGNGETGWVEHRGCFINLPDIIPSIVYEKADTMSSPMRVTYIETASDAGFPVHNVRVHNPRFDRYEFIVPVLYSMSGKIFDAQQAALADGNTIVIVETFRPRAVQIRLVENLRYIMEHDEEVYNAINTPPWSLNWFVSTSVSHHQRGAAADATIGRIVSREIRKIGEFVYMQITEFEEMSMPTAMHELVPAAAVFRYPVSSRSTYAWRTATLADTFTEDALLLQRYFTDAGFTPLASEWWHFNDLESVQIATELGLTGEFFIETIYSVAP